MCQYASPGDPDSEFDITKKAYEKALELHAARKDWEGILVTSAIALGSLENVPMVGFVVKAIAMIGKALDGMKRHRKQVKEVWEKLQGLRGYLIRLHGRLPHDADTLKRTAEVVLGGLVLIGSIEKPYSGPRPLLR